MARSSDYAAVVYVTTKVLHIESTSAHQQPLFRADRFNNVCFGFNRAGIGAGDVVDGEIIKTLWSSSGQHGPGNACPQGATIRSPS